MKMMGDTLGAVGCALELTDLNTGDAFIENTAQFDASLQNHYEERIFHINPRIRAAMSMPIGTIADDSRLIDHSLPGNREFLDWLNQSPYYYIIGAKLLHVDGKVGFLTANLSKSQGMATREHHQAFAALTPHLMNALSVSRALSDNALKGQLIALEALGSQRAFALLSRDGRILDCSAGFEAIVQAQTVLGTHQRRLTAIDPRFRQDLERFLHSALTAAPIRDQPRALRLSSPSAPRGVVLRAVRIAPTNDVFDIFKPAALLTVTDLDQPRRVRRQDLVAMFGLTEREAEIASLISEGNSTEASAQLLEISDATVRQHLKSIFAKLDVSRQAELVCLVSRLA